MNDRAEAPSTFIIATRNRPEELLRAVESLVAQTVLPRELCIVDSSAEAPLRATIEELCSGVGISLVYLEPDCHEEILKEYERWGEFEQWGPELGGVAATPTHPEGPGTLSVLWRRLFGIGGWWTEASGRMRSGFWVEGVLESAR